MCERLNLMKVHEFASLVASQCSQRMKLGCRVQMTTRGEANTSESTFERVPVAVKECFLTAHEPMMIVLGALCQMS